MAATGQNCATFYDGSSIIIDPSQMQNGRFPKVNSKISSASTINWSRLTCSNAMPTLFDSGTVLVRPPGHQWDVNEKLADQLRVEAVEALISQGGAADILRLARAVKNAGWVGRATMESSASDAIKAELIKTGLRSDDQREADLAYGIIIGGRVLRSPTWTDDLWDRATSEGWGPRAVERLLFALPIDRATWNRAAAAGADVETAYWQQVSVFFPHGSSDEVIYAAEKLIGASRARHAVNLLGQNVQTGLPSALIVRALRSALLEKIGADGSSGNDLNMFSYYIAKLFQGLDAAADVGAREIVELEWAYFHVLQHSERPARTLQKALASNPAFFMQILCAVYVPSKDSGIVEPEPEDSEKAQAVALQAWRLLRDWRRVPGSDDNGGGEWGPAIPGSPPWAIARPSGAAVPARGHEKVLTGTPFPRDETGATNRAGRPWPSWAFPRAWRLPTQRPLDRA
jgi:hypothetical protein